MADDETPSDDRSDGDSTDGDSGSPVRIRSKERLS